MVLPDHEKVPAAGGESTKAFWVTAWSIGMSKVMDRFVSVGTQADLSLGVYDRTPGFLTTLMWTTSLYHHRCPLMVTGPVGSMIV